LPDRRLLGLGTLVQKASYRCIFVQHFHEMRIEVREY